MLKWLDHHALDHAADNDTAERKSPMTKRGALPVFRAAVLEDSS